MVRCFVNSNKSANLIAESLGATIPKLKAYGQVAVIVSNPKKLTRPIIYGNLVRVIPRNMRERSIIHTGNVNSSAIT